MNVKDLLARANRLQQSTPFKVAASILVVVIAIAGFSVYAITATAPDLAPPAPAAVEAQPAPGEEGPSASERSAIESISRITSDILARRTDFRGVGIGIAAGAGVNLIVIWLGLGLTYLGVLCLGAFVITPMWFLGGTSFASGIFLDEAHRTSLGEWLRGAARLLGGLVTLAWSFIALMQGLRALVSSSGPVFAVARNVLAEAVRMKVSLVFMILLVFFLAALPDQLNETTPLRYRVQTFLQYGTGGSFWVIAILVLFFGVGTVAFEQRDRQIWQTMTKPVAAWQYILGKWIGVAGLAAVLLAVSTSGVFLFTEHLRQQPAHGEDRTVQGGAPTNDRLILETQVLTARVSVSPQPALRRDSEEFKQGVRSFIESRRVQEPGFATDDATYEKVASDLFKQLDQNYRTIEPGSQEIYRFTGLQKARERGGVVILRFRVESGANLPSTTYRVSFMFGGFRPEVQEIGLSSTHSIELLSNVINDDGTAELVVFNGDVFRGTANPYAITFPPGGLELSYSVGGFRANFARAALVLWVKLAFLAMLAIACATFLSFPVACMVAFSTFLAAEGASFLSESLQYYDAADEKNNIIPHRVVIRVIGLGVAGMFQIYADLRPTAKLVDGRLISLGSVASGTAILAAWSAMLYGTAVFVFRKRELATYSGQ